MQAISFSSVARAASTAFIERSRPTASGTTVSGKSVVFCSGRTAISNTSGFGSFSAFSCSACLFSLAICPPVRRVFAFCYCLCLFQRNDEKAVIEDMFELNALDRCREFQGLFKARIGYLHLMIRPAEGTRPVFSGAGNVKDVSLHV